MSRVDPRVILVVDVSHGADVVVWSPGSRLAQELTPVRLQEVAPHAIVVSMTVFGLDGPWAGRPASDLTLLECGSYACPACHAAHAVVTSLRDRFGERLCYGFRHLPIERPGAWEAACLAEVAAASSAGFWPVHDALMQAGPEFVPGELERIAAEFVLPSRDSDPAGWRAAEERVGRHAASGRASGALVTPTFLKISDSRLRTVSGDRESRAAISLF